MRLTASFQASTTASAVSSFSRSQSSRAARFVRYGDQPPVSFAHAFAGSNT
jgi:hypothetical protein